jgi:hypothetical protein
MEPRGRGAWRERAQWQNATLGPIRYGPRHHGDQHRAVEQVGRVGLINGIEIGSPEHSSPAASWPIKRASSRSNASIV